MINILIIHGNKYNSVTYDLLLDKLFENLVVKEW